MPINTQKAKKEVIEDLMENPKAYEIMHKLKRGLESEITNSTWLHILGNFTWEDLHSEFDLIMKRDPSVVDLSKKAQALMDIPGYGDFFRDKYTDPDRSTLITYLDNIRRERFADQKVVVWEDEGTKNTAQKILD